MDSFTILSRQIKTIFEAFAWLTLGSMTPDGGTIILAENQVESNIHITFYEIQVILVLIIFKTINYFINPLNY